ncbi:MAG: phosphoserine phosphatase SerB [Paracoccus denitrificans]|nr:MAG: phosphoserine phosphatase SerB [Paracoccus denitrificans]PZO85258.1 MAG: phosphoserine phosphatase SerB [Paracoccus denitrificans]
MFTISLISSPDRGDLSDDLIRTLRQRWDGGDAAWLDYGVAAEFSVSTRPVDFAPVWMDLQRVRIDMAIQPSEGRRKAVLLADMDSTMIEQECIDELAAMAGIGPEVAKITARAMNGELNFHESLVARVSLLKGLSVDAITKVLAQRITYTPGGATLVATMRAHGAWTALVSGGFTDFTGPVGRHLGFDEQRANVLITDGDHLTGQVALPILGREAKAEALRDITATRNLTAADVIAVGDGANDLGMLEIAGTGVALHAKPAVAAAAPICINFGDLTSLLYLQGYAADEFVGA